MHKYVEKEEVGIYKPGLDIYISEKEIPCND